MEKYMDDYESYKRYEQKCPCWCTAHCGFSCQTDGCDCTECKCPMCAEEQDK
jgi:hypothetical protein